MRVVGPTALSGDLIRLSICIAVARRLFLEGFKDLSVDYGMARRFSLTSDMMSVLEEERNGPMSVHILGVDLGKNFL